jgi:GT2 family glycosyltransferase/glycosyltransferase involved in cell wall biosynthesis/predicted Zn-dependent protease
MPSKNFPKISIITPSYNQGGFLEETIQSVLNQKYPNLQYIIIDGGSADNSAEIIRKYEQYLYYWVSEKDRGQAHAINKGFIRATGDILAWLNSDDFYYPNTLNYIAQAYQKYPEAGLYIGNGYIVDKNRKIIRPFSESIGFDATTLINGQNYINQPSVFINRKAVDKAGLLDESLNNEFDVEYWIRTGSEFEAVVMDEFLSAFRWYDEIKTASSAFNRWVEMFKVRQRYTDKPLTAGLLVEFLHIARNQSILNELGTDIKDIIEKAYQLIFSRNQEKLNLKNNVPAGRGIYFIPDKNLTLPATEQKISAPPLILHTGSNPKVDIVLQATGTHSWGVYGGWANAAHKLGILNRVFTPKAQWEAPDVTDDDGLYSYLLNPQADIMLLPGFDWHSQMLHTSAKWRDRWMNTNILKILFSHEAIEESCILFENDLMKKAALSAAECVDGIIHIDLNDIDFWKQTNKPLLWQLLGVDDRIFSVQKQFRERIARPFFRGQFTPHFTSKTYAQRRDFMQFLIDNNAVEVLEYIKGQKPDKVVKDFNNYQIAVNLPTLSAYHPSRVTEAMACGCALITNRTGIRQLDDLFIHREHLLYYSSKEDLLESVRLLSSDRAFSEQLANNGHVYALEHFTLDKLLLEILRWSNNSALLKGGRKDLVEQFIQIADIKQDRKPIQSVEPEKKKKIIIDGAIFYLHQGRPLGIGRLWKSLLTELSHGPLADQILVLDRDSTAPFIPGIRWKTIKGYDHIHFEDDSLYLEEICRVENAALFISTYYTYPENSPCALMLYDMIPELTGMDLSLPEWRAKAKAIEKAHAYFSISESTRNDFGKLYPHYSHKEIYITYPAVSEEFRQNSSAQIDSFKKEHDIQRPYFMLVGHRALYKNAHLFFRAFSLLENKSDFEVLCTGGAKELEKVFLPYIKGSRCQVRFLSDRDLSIAYSGAVALAYPSQYEGFGLPILEAMKSGCPVITCRNSSIPEVAADAAFYVNVHDVAGMKDALIKIQDPHIRKNYITRGIKNASRFSWANTCTQFITALNEIIINIKNIRLNLTDPLNTKGRLFYILAQRHDCSNLLSAMKHLEQVNLDKESCNSSELLKYEDIISHMNADIFNLFQRDLTDSDGAEGFLHFCYGLALEQQGSLQKALNAYLMAKTQSDLGDVLHWRVTYSAFDIAYQLENLQLAKELLKEFLSANPNFYEGKKKLQEIEKELKQKLPEVKQKTIDTKASELFKKTGQNSKIKVSAIVSAYNSEKFIRGCLEDLVNQTLYKKGELEIVVVDSGSQENERAAVDEFKQKYPNIIYLRTEERETAYGAWNRGIKAACGKYITNANTDDRHRKNALEVMAGTLDNFPEIALVYGDQILTETENETFDHCTPVGYFSWPEFDRIQLFHCPFIGPQPMWRRSLHDEFGHFDDSLKIAGDYDWWLRISEKYSFRHIPELLGLYFLSPKGLEASNHKLSWFEAGKVRQLYGEKANITCDFDRFKMSFRVNEYPLMKDGIFDHGQRANPLVSVIVPTFNRPDMLRETLNSILNQTYKNFEIIVVNDAGIDVDNIISDINKDGIITYKKQATNKGLAASRNTGIQAAKGKYIAYLDDDDIFYPEHLETLVNFLESSNYKVAYTDAFRAYQAEENGEYIVKKKELPSSSDFDHNRILISNFIPVLCFMHEKSCLDEVGPFDEALTSHEDWDLWIRLSRKFQFGHIKKTTAEYGFRIDGSTMFSNKRADMLRTMEIIHAKYSSAEDNPSLIQARSSTLGALRHEVFNTRSDTVSIIIPTFNKLALTCQCLNAIRQTADNIPYEIIVVDNGSTDGTPDYLLREEAVGRIRVILNRNNLGFSKANNQGAQIARGKYLLFLNNDTIPQPKWLEEMVHMAESDGNIGAVGSKLLFPDGTIQHAGVVLFRTKKPYHIYKGLPGNILCANKQRDYKIVTAACMLIRKNIFSEIGGFDDRFINGCEDLDLCLKVGQKNKRIVYNPRSVVIHLEAQSKGRQDNMDYNRQLFENIWRDKIVPDDLYFLKQDGMESMVDPEGVFYFVSSEKINKLKTSIIIVTFNSAPTIRVCLDSVLHNSPGAEVIVVDNASADETQLILRDYEASKLIIAIINYENKGFSYACNQGIRASSGEYIILLNPDTIATPDWTSHMLAHFRPEVGAAGPISNFVAALQQAPLYAKEPLRKDSTIDELARKFYHWNRGKGKETKLLMGFCMAFPRKVLNEVGLLDEDLFLGNDDLEISWRIRQHGYKLIIATDTFIYHEGQVSFKSQKERPSTGDSTQRLYEKLVQHYGEGNVPHPIELWGIDFFEPKGAKFRSLKPTFAAVYCVYDDIAWLRDSLESIYSAVDAVYFLISDKPWYGQATDNKTTIDCIRTFPDPHSKIEIIHGKWSNETDQRNAGLDILKEKDYTYCFVIDADEVYNPAELKRMMDLVVSHPEVDCWHISLDTYWKSYHYRIEPREPLKPPVFVKAGEVRFTQNRLAAGKSHEMILPDIGICHHLSYAHSDDEILKKISTFSHANEVIPGWFENVWKRWDSDHSMRNIHPTHPQAYQQAVEQPYSALPPVLKKRYLKDEKIGGNIISGLTSIIILAHNQWDQTELCLKSIARHTPEPHELIVVDNGSSDETRTRLRSLLKTKTNLKVIGNKANRGFAAGNNQGIAIAQGEYILLLNNDTIVTEGWLSHMIDIFKKFPETGIVGPMSNYVSGPQLVPDVGYEKIEEIDSFADKWKKENEAESFSIHRVVGFCLLTKRDVIDRIGGLDEQFGSGNFEDDDFCLRASLTGYRARVAQDVFIHHTGSQTFRGAGIDYQNSLLRNWELFKGKWGIPSDTQYGSAYQLPIQQVSKINPYEPLPHLPSDHKADNDKRLWEEINQKKHGKKQVEVKLKERVKGLTSIIMLISKEQEHAQKCIQGIQKHTKEPYEILLIPSQASLSPPKWFRKLAKENSNYKLLANIETGFAKACNQGIRNSSGEYIVLFDDMVTLTEDWLSGMIECLTSSSDIGIAGPMTVHVDGPQNIPDAEYNFSDGLDVYARSFREKNRYRRIQTRTLDSFCMIFKYELVEKIGLFDERFEIYEYTDDDYCLRVALEGLKNVIAGDVFIHYNGHKNSLNEITNAPSPLIRDKKIYSEKWGDFEESRLESEKLFSTNALFVADELSQKGQKEKAVLTLLEGIKVNPDDKRLHYAIAEILIEEKKFREALDILEHMPSVIKKEPESLELIGYCKEGLELIEEANSYADEILQLNISSPKAWNLKGAVAFKKELYAEAEKYFSRALEADRGFGEACSNLGALKWIRGNREEALRLFEKAFILSPTLGDVVTNYYTAVVSLSKLTESERIFQEAIALHPLNRRLNFVLIDNLLQQKKFNEAMKALEYAMEIFGIDDDTLSVSLNLRARVGAIEIDMASQESISLCMITKNEEKNIIRSLQSAKPLVNEIIIVDTGSTDRTKNIARAFGAKIYDFSWTNDFSAARNFALSKAACSWILVLDADEVISTSDYNKLKELVKNSVIKKAAYSIVTRNYVGPVSVNWNPNDGKYKEEAGSGWFPSEKVRLFPNDRRIRFEKPVHEMVEFSIMRIGLEIRKCDIPIHHYGKLDKEEIRAKGEEYYQLGKKKLEEHGEYNPNALYELAVQASELEKYDESLGFWKKLIAVKPDLAKAYHGLGTCCFQLGRYEEALEAFKKAIELDPDSKDPGVMYASCELCMGNAEAAVSHLEGLLKKNPMFPLALLAITAAYFCAGRKKKGLEYVRKVEKTQFSLAHYLKDIAKLLSSVKRFDYSILLLEAAIETNNTMNETRQLLAECYEKQKDSRMQEAGVSSDELKKNIAPQTPPSANLGNIESSALSGEAPGTLSLCMIVKNEEANIERSILSVKPVVNEMIVVDTGSTDRTKDIALALGAKIYDFTWIDNFSEARNFSLSKATSKWVLILDADEVISPLDHETLKRFLADSHAKPTAYTFITRNYVIEANTAGWIANDGKYFNEEAGTGWYPGEKVRLFPKDSRIQFEFPVHERIEPSLFRYGITMGKSDIPIHHYGKLNGKKADFKAEQYYLLGKRKLAESPDQDAMAIYELAIQGSELGRHEETLELLNKVIKLRPDFTKAYQSIGNAYFNLSRYEDALPSYKKAMELNPDSRDIVLMYATCLVYTGSAEASIPILEVLLKNDPRYHQAMLILAESYFCAGIKDKGLESINKLKESNIDYEDYFTSLANMFISLQRFNYAISLLEAVMESENAPGKAEILLKECYNKMKDSQKGQ